MVDRREKRARFWLAMRADIRRVAELEGRPDGVAPSSNFYQEHGRWGCTQVQRFVGGTEWKSTDHRTRRPKYGWSEAVEKLGFVSAMRAYRLGDKRDLILDLKEVAMRVGKGPREMPTVDEYAEHGQWSRPTVIEHLSEDGTWRSAAETAGLRASRRIPYGSLTLERMTEDYIEACLEAGYEPGGHGLGCTAFDRLVPYSAQNTRLKCGSWSAFVAQAGFKPRPEGDPRAYEEAS